jgi:hypothetical protein
MSKLIYRKTNDFEFVEYPYRMDYIAVIFKQNKITLKPILNVVEKDFLNLDYNFGVFEFENKKYNSKNYNIINEIPDWFRAWSKENIYNELIIDYSDFKEIEIMNKNRENYLQKIGLIN